MLSSLKIENVAVIEKAEILFGPGLNVLTGETGAGKSIIIDSINLLKGDRASKSIIRSGTEWASVSAVFEPEEDVKNEIDDILGCETEDELIISRTLSQDGKNTIRINGMPVNLAMLKAVGELLINIHGQHDNTSLLSEKTHIAFLDGFGKEETAPLLSEYKVIFDKCKQISEEIESIDTDEQEKLRRMDMLKFQTEELEEASLEVGEDEQLMARKTVLDNAQRISENTKRAYDTLYGGENGTAHDFIWEALGYLEKIAPFDADISSIYDDISDIAENLDEKVRELRLASDNMNFDASEADSIEEAEEMGYDISIETEWNGNSVFTYDDAQLCADGEPRDIEVELIDGEEDEEDEW
jgi:DNA repair protein RecN (Recombination protein N)